MKKYLASYYTEKYKISIEFILLLLFLTILTFANYYFNHYFNLLTPIKELYTNQPFTINRSLYLLFSFPVWINIVDLAYDIIKKLFFIPENNENKNSSDKTKNEEKKEDSKLQIQLTSNNNIQRENEKLNENLLNEQKKNTKIEQQLQEYSKDIKDLKNLLEKALFLQQRLYDTESIKEKSPEEKLLEEGVIMPEKRKLKDRPNKFEKLAEIENNSHRETEEETRIAVQLMHDKIDTVCAKISKDNQIKDSFLE